MLNNNKQFPDFIGIGTMKAASSWIYSCLTEHPDICDRVKKEIHFFDHPHNYRQGIEYYLSHFRNCPPKKLKGEFTAKYMFFPEVAERIHEHLPDGKILVCLRDPAERAWSHYRFGVQTKGVYSLYNDFREALDKEEELLGLGYYYKQLKRFFDLFPRENIMVLIYEEVKKAPLSSIQNIYEFLGVDSSYRPAHAFSRIHDTSSIQVQFRLPALNRTLYAVRVRIGRYSGIARSLRRMGVDKKLKKIINQNKIKTKSEDAKEDVPTMKEEDRKYLQEAYSRDIEKLEELLNKDLSIWKNQYE